MIREGVRITGSTETHWMGQKCATTGELETIIHPGREDDKHREGIGVLLQEMRLQNR